MGERKNSAMVEVTLDLGDLKPTVKEAAKDAGVTVDEFIADAIKWRISQDYYHERKEFTPHGGKHKMGKSTGYEVTDDGKYYPASMWTEQFEYLFAERETAYNLVNYIVAQSEARLKDVERRIQETKKRLIDDLRLDPQKQWAYYGGNKQYMAEVPKADDAED